jgi:DNA-binding beta-propeller fold protein YncE
VEPTADGGYLIADYSNRVVRRVSATGKIKTVAGTPGVGGYAGDGGRAISALLSGPTAVTETRDGGFLIADVTNHCIRKVSPTGIITTVAGTGVAGRGRDRRPATSSALRKPGGVAVAWDKSSILIADSGNNRVRRVASDGTITTVAGTGTPGYSGDGGPATQAQLDHPGGLVATPDGGFLIADTMNRVVRWVSSDGVIRTVAGNGTFGFSGDGGRATSAQLGPVDVALLPAGGFLVADRANHAIRRVSSWKGGKIDTVAGSGIAGFSGDGGPARAARMNLLAAVATRADGSFLIADAENHRIRLVEPLGDGPDWPFDFGR